MTDKELDQIQQEAIDKANEEHFAKMPPQELRQVETIKKVNEILTEAKIPFWLFTEQNAPDGFPLYVQHNWFSRDFDLEGNLTETGREFLQQHYEGLMYSLYWIICEGFLINAEKSPQNVFDAFVAAVGNQMRERAKLN
jgi:hypothetical protein